MVDVWSQLNRREAIQVVGATAAIVVTGGVIPDPIAKGVPDLPTNAFFAYGHYEGIPRLLDLMDKHAIKLSSFMIGKAVETSPEIAREIVKRGHEAAAHGRIGKTLISFLARMRNASSPAAWKLSSASPDRSRLAGMHIGCAMTSTLWKRCRILGSSITLMNQATTNRSYECKGGTSSLFLTPYI
jgi:hypothetical protein